ncbi:hypothetical protein ACLOJK_028071 [Asimina triloba]
MARILPTSLQIPFPSPQIQNSRKSPKPLPYPFSLKAVDPQNEPSSSSSSNSTPEPDSDPDSTALPDSEFESRLAQVRVRYRSGTGKKAELRKARKSQATKKKGGGSIFLPPVPLKDAIAGGLKVDFGFCPYTERLHGRLAALGLTALLLVELASGTSVIKYHTPAILFVQLYFVAAVTAVFVKYEKEKVSIWPEAAVKK